jgi:PAS domain S-box-containing protein
MWWIVLLRLIAAAVMVTVIVRLVQSHRRERKTAERWAMISNASVALAEILRADTTLEDVLRLLVPGFADWCAIHLLEDDGVVRRAAVVHVDPALELRVRNRLSEVPFVTDAPLGPAKVIRTGEADLLYDSSQGQILAGQVDPALLSEAGIGSRISVPLRARQKTIGALTLHRRAARGYDESDLEWAQELARRITLAIENTRLYTDARRLFEESASANWVSNEEGRVLACNQMFTQLLGFASIDEALATPAVELYADPSERIRIMAELKSQRRIAGRETSFRRHDDGREVSTLVNAFGEFDATGELRRLTGFILDRSAQKDLEEQLRQSQRLEAVGQLAGGIAHDFNNLLTVIIGCADLMAMDGDRPAVEGDHDPLEELTNAARRAASLTQQLLAFSRRQILQPRMVSLNDSLRAVHTMLRRLVRENVMIVMNIDPRIARVRVDPGQIDQVIVNLVLNSAYAMPDGGTITLSTTNIEIAEGDSGLRPYVHPGSYIGLVVRDTGSGMDEGTRARAFEPFFTTKPLGKGTGLGLSTVYGIIKQSGGYVWIDSELGVGTTVTICFQAEAEAVA